MKSVVMSLLALSQARLGSALVRVAQPLSRLEARSFASSGGKYRNARRRATPSMALRVPAASSDRGCRSRDFGRRATGGRWADRARFVGAGDRARRSAR